MMGAGVTTREPKRFPRLPKGQEVATLAQLVWTQPEFELRLTKKQMTEFVFRIPAPGDLRKEQPALYRVLLGPKGADWGRALSVAYWKSKSGKKSVREYINILLYRVFNDALKMLFEQTWNVDEKYADIAGQELKTYQKKARRSSGPQISLKQAVWMAQRYDELLPQLRDLRVSLKKRADKLSNEIVVKEIEQTLPYDLLRRALGKLLHTSERRIGPEHLTSPRVTPRQIALAVIECELEDRHQRFRSITIAKHIRKGKTVVELFAGLPRS
jgi:hypothetical protein